MPKIIKAYACMEQTERQIIVYFSIYAQSATTVIIIRATHKFAKDEINVPLTLSGYRDKTHKL